MNKIQEQKATDTFTTYCQSQVCSSNKVWRVCKSQNKYPKMQFLNLGLLTRYVWKSLLRSLSRTLQDVCQYFEPLLTKCQVYSPIPWPKISPKLPEVKLPLFKRHWYNGKTMDLVKMSVLLLNSCVSFDQITQLLRASFLSYKMRLQNISHMFIRLSDTSCTRRLTQSLTHNKIRKCIRSYA